MEGAIGSRKASHMNVLREVDYMPHRPTTTMGKVIYEFTDEQFKDIIETVRKTTVEELSKKKAADRFLTREEAATYLRIQPATLNRWLNEGKLPTSLRHVVGTSILFSMAELENFVKQS
jgi:excisionase family DNA binding protein